MAVSRVQFGSTTGSTNSLTLTLGSPTTAGNLLVVAYSADGGTSPTGVTLVGSSDTFTKDANIASTNTVANINLSMWSDPNCSGGHTQVNVTASTSNGLLLMVWEIAGAATSPPLAGTPGTAGNPTNTFQTSFDSTAGASVSAGCFWVGALTGIGSGGRATPSVSGGVRTMEAQLQPGSASDMLGAYQAGPGAGWAAIAAAYKPLAVPVTTSGLLLAGIV
jgi:hypothetical protein